MKVAEIFQSGMILQREKPIIIWGTAYAEEKITVSVQEKMVSSTADAQGNWKVELPPLKASENERLVIASVHEVITYTDIAVGEVWIAGGQSNMEFYMRYEKHLKEEKGVCKNRRIRFFDVPEIAFDGQREAFDYSRMGIWRTADAEDIEYFSAVGYYFEKELEEELDVPVGIIGCNWGGTTSSVWMSAESVKRVGKPWVEAYQSKMAGLDMDEYWANQRKSFLNGRGNPFADPFSEMVLPRTPSQDEVKAFFESMNMDDAGVMEPQPQSIPGCLYEHMVKTIASFTVRGVLWYQGESDDDLDRQELYEEMLKAVIGDWRDLWKDETLPFLIVQLPGWERWLDMVNKNYPIIRRCQEAVVNSDENCFLCSISDAGEQMDIHPKNKKVVGHRLALLALGHIYGRDILCDAPVVDKIQRDSNEIRLKFAHAEGGLHVEGESIHGLQIVPEMDFQTAIEGDTLVITLEKDLPDSVKINFAQEKWYRVNLYNESNIPAIPFIVE